MQSIFKWDLFRTLRFSMGIFFIIQGLMERSIWTGLFGVLFSGMALFNVGCCAGGTCATTTTKSTNETKEIIYEEIDHKQQA